MTHADALTRIQEAHEATKEALSWASKESFWPGKSYYEAAIWEARRRLDKAREYLEEAESWLPPCKMQELKDSRQL